MRDIYATTMHIVDIGGGDAFEVACKRAMDWAWRIDDKRPDLRKRPAGRLPENAGPEETTVEWWAALEGQARALELRLRHPDTQDETLQWLATITISDIEGTTRATVRLERGASVHVLRPWQLDLAAPLVVLELMRPPLLAYAGSLELTPGTRMLQSDDVGGFIGDVLRADGRALPVLIVSCSVSPSVAQSLAKALAGLVQVVRLTNEDAEDALRRALRKSGYVVPRGGLRLYWPGFGLTGQPRRHPYWTAAQIREGGDSGQAVIKHLVDLLAPISTGRVPADPGVLRARREWLRTSIREQRSHQEAQRARARRERQKAAKAIALAHTHQDASEEVDRLKDQLAEIKGQFTATEEERDTALAQAEEAAANELKVIEESLGIKDQAAVQGKHVAQLEAENDALRKSFKTIATHQAEAALETGDTIDTVPNKVASWGEVAEWLPALEGPGFSLTDQALESADGKGRYPHPSAIWKALRGLERVGRIYNELGSDLGMRFDEFALQEGGIDVALQDSSYEEECFFEFEGDEHKRLPHVKVDDAKSPNEVGRIYFALDPDHKRLIVDWFGTKPDRPKTRRVGALGRASAKH